MTDDAPPEPRSRTASDRRSILLPLTAVVMAIVVAVALAGAAFALRDRHPDGGSVEAGFLRDMVTHHNQVVEMSLITYRRSADPEMVTLTYDLATAQQSQVGMMMATLDLWGLSQTGSDPAMTWMGQPVLGLMPGMATPEQVDRLQTLPPDQADILLLQLMVVHHRAGIDMANALLDTSDDDDVRRLAETFSRTQGAEVENMNAMLVARGQPPVDGTSTAGMGHMNGITTTTSSTPSMDMDHGG